MTDTADLETVERKARALFGDYAARWLSKPNRSLAQLSPHEMARSATGARLVLWELERTILTEDPSKPQRKPSAT